MSSQSDHEHSSSDLEDAAAIWLCQLPGMTPALALRLVAEYESASGVLHAPSGALRSLGVFPSLLPRLIAGQRSIPQVKAGLKALLRLGIMPLPLVRPTYPQRLLVLPQPPLVLYVQGPWPISDALPLVMSSPDVAPAVCEAWMLFQQNAPVQFAVAGLHGDAIHESVPPRLLGVPFGLMLARQRLATPLMQSVRNNATTLISVSLPTSPPDPASIETIQDGLLALADGLIVLAGGVAEQAFATARRINRPIWMFGAAPRESLPAGVRRLRSSKAGLRQLLATLGVHHSETETVRQEQLF